ncbi:MAG: sensor histidine kinase [Desulfobacteraceae bacterium]|nr:sensor histidine kinase [Desulfobacteraceae bacterium]
MKTSIYKNLQRKIIFITLLVSFAPLIILGAAIYYQFARMYEDKIQEQIRYRASSQTEAVDLFLKERIAVLSAAAQSHSCYDLSDEKHLSHIFSLMNLRGGAFVDLGIIDDDGQHRAYVGPYNLKGLNYYKEKWFAEVMDKGVYISDVYFGYRKLPHFIIAILHHEDQNLRILRATIYPEVLGAIVREAQMGKSGDAFLINKKGIYQTIPRFDGKLLSQSNLDTTLFGGGTTFFEKEKGQGRKLLYAGAWLKKKKWLLITTQEASEEMSGLLTARNVEISIIAFGALAIILTAIFTTRLFVNRLKESDTKMGELNAQLVQSDKLAALGKMGASVAHEINNPLIIIIQIIGWIEDLLAEEELQQSKYIEEFKTSLKKVSHHLERIRKVVHNMLGYARRMEPHLEDVDVNNTLNQTIDLLENYARINNIDIQTDLTLDVPIIANDPAQLQQVFLNLVSNAIDAVGSDGLIEVKSENSKSHINVIIADNGPGISKDQQRKVFDPFFTTKQDGKGTGLGLWVSYNIMEKMGGIITFKSEEGKGTTFTVKIPIVIPEKK